MGGCKQTVRFPVPVSSKWIWRELAVMVVGLLLLTGVSVVASAAINDYRQRNVVVDFIAEHDLTQRQETELQQYVRQWVQQRPSLDQRPEDLRQLCERWLDLWAPTERFDPLS